MGLGKPEISCKLYERIHASGYFLTCTRETVISIRFSKASVSRETLKMNVPDDLQVDSRSDLLRQVSDGLMKGFQDDGR